MPASMQVTRCMHVHVHNLVNKSTGVICKVDQTLLDGGWLERHEHEVERLSVCGAVVRLDAVEGALHVCACTCAFARTRAAHTPWVT